MAYGKILADGFENSNGVNFDLVEATTSEATTSAKGYMSSSDKTKLDGIAPSSIAGVDTTVSASTATNSSSTSYTHQGSTNDSFGGTTLYQYSCDNNSTFNTWFAALQAALPASVTVTNTDSSTVTFTADSAYVDFSSEAFKRVKIESTASDVGYFEYKSLSTLTFGSTTYDATLTGTETPVFDSTKAVTVGGTAYAAGEWTVSGTSATKSFSADPSLSGTVAVFQQPVQSYEFESVSYPLANASELPSAATASVDGLLVAADKSKIDGFRVDESYVIADAGTLTRYDATATGTGTKENNFLAGFEIMQQGLTVSGNDSFKHNVMIGSRLAGQDAAGSNISTYQYNVILGSDAMRHFAGGQRCVAIGNEALQGNSAASDTFYTTIETVAVGYRAGHQSSGNRSVFIGSDAGNAGGSTGNNLIAIGYLAGTSQSPSGALSGTTENTICLGDNNITDIYCADTTISSSDARDKTDIEDFAAGLSFIDALRPVTYKWDKRTSYLAAGDLDTSILDITPDGTHKKERLNVGFLAQEVEQVEKDHGYANDKNDRLFSSLNAEETAMGVKYERLIPVLVNAIKELKAEIDDLKSQLN